MNNLDTALSTLAGEINALEINRAGENKGKQIDMGHKLIAVRELLRQKNGICSGGRPDVTGNLAPKGWFQWVKDNLTLSLRQATYCVQYAGDPEGTSKRSSARSRKTRGSPTGALMYAKRAWPIWTKEQRDEFCAGVLNLMETS